jgi:hypothetical protein
MSGQQHAYVPPRRRFLNLWIAAAVAVVGIVFGVTPAVSHDIADASLEPGLLVAADFPPQFHVSTMTRAELDRLPGTPAQPDTVNPTECSELLRLRERQPGGRPVAIVQASDGDNGVTYVQQIAHADTASWDPRWAESMLAKCDEMTIAYKGVTVTMYSSRVEGIAGDGYARSITTGEDYGIGGVTVGVAVTKVGDNVVTFTGVSLVLSMRSVFDEDQFVRLANAANERVRARL